MMPKRTRGGEEQNFWISYADLMAGLLFVFILLVGAIVVKTVLIRTDLQAIRADLQKEKAALEMSDAALAEKKKRLAELQARLRSSKEENLHLSFELARFKKESEALRGSLADTQADLEAQKGALAKNRAALQLSKKEMASLKGLLLETQMQAETLGGELNTTQARANALQAALAEARTQHEHDLNTIRLRDDELVQLEKTLLQKSRDYQKAVEDLNITRLKVKHLTGIKVKVVQRLKAELGDFIRIDPETGALRFSSNILFNQGEYVLKEEGKRELAVMLERYIHTLLTDPAIRTHIDLITIEGHTNSDGSYPYNLDLSQKRALAVMAFLYERYPAKRTLFRRYLSAAGRSYAEPVLKSDGREDKEASRRIEIKFRIKNEEAVRELMHYLSRQHDEQ